MDKIFTPEIAGYVQIKRKRFWVIRYAQIINGIFYYYQNNKETTPRQVIKLSECSVNEQLSADGEKLILLFYSNQEKSKALQITANNQKDHQIWLNRLKYYCDPQCRNILSQSQISQSNNNIIANPPNLEDSKDHQQQQIQQQQPFYQQQQNQNMHQNDDSENDSINSSQILTKAQSQNNQLFQSSPQQSPQNLQKTQSQQQFPQNRLTMPPLQQNNQLQPNINNNEINQNLNFQQQQQPKQKAFPESQQQQQQQQTFMTNYSPQFFQVDKSLLTPESSSQSSKNALQDLKANVQMMLCEFKPEQQILVDADKEMQVFAHNVQPDDKYYEAEQEDLDYLQTVVEKLVSIGSGFVRHLENFYAKHSFFFFIYLSILVAAAFWSVYCLVHIVDRHSTLLSVLFTLNILFLPYVFIKIKKYRKKQKYIYQPNNNILNEKNAVSGDTPLYKIQVKYLFPHNANEFLFVVQQEKVRRFWQPFTLSALLKEEDRSLQITYQLSNNQKITETCFQAAYKENDFVYFVEYTALKRPLRIFKIFTSPTDEKSCEIHYFITDTCCQLQKMRNYNSPILLKALNCYLKTLKINSKSIIYDYYHSKLQVDQNSLLPQQQQIIVNQKSDQKQSQQQKQYQSQNIISPQNQQQSQLLQSQKLIDLSQSQSPNKFVQKQQQQVIQDPNNQPPFQSAELNQQQRQMQTQYNQQQQEISEDQVEESKLPPEKQKYLTKLNTALETLISVSHLTPQNAWQSLNKKGNFQTHYKDDEVTNQNYCRGEGPINASASEIAAYLSNFDLRGEYDEMYHSGYKLEELMPDVSISYQRFKGKMGVSDRDFAMVGGKVEKNGVFYVLGTSVLHDKIPPIKDIVRGELVIGGWILTPVESNKTNAVYVLCSDPKGKLPGLVKSWASKLQSGVVQKVSELFDKKKKIK